MRPIMCLIIVLFALLPQSCRFEKEQRGFPERVFMGPEAATISYKGNDIICQFILRAGDRQVFSRMEGDSIFVTLGWLTVKAKAFGDEMIIITEPMEGTTSRKASIEGSFGDAYFITNVTQKR